MSNIAYLWHCTASQYDETPLQYDGTAPQFVRTTSQYE